MPHPPWSTNHRPRGQVLQSARSPALPSPRQLRVSGFTSLTTPPHTHTCAHTHTQSHSHRPVREVSRRTWVLSTHPERSPGPSSPRAGGFRGFRRLRLEALPLPDPSPPGRAAAKVKDHLLSGLRNRDTGEPQPHGTVGTRPLHLVHLRYRSAWQTSALRDCHPCPQKGRRALLAEGHQADGEEPSFQTVALGSRLIPTIHQLWHLSEPQSLHLH